MSQCLFGLHIAGIIFRDIVLNCFAFVVDFQTPNKSLVFKPVSWKIKLYLSYKIHGFGSYLSCILQKG